MNFVELYQNPETLYSRDSSLTSDPRDILKLRVPFREVTPPPFPEHFRVRDKYVIRYVYVNSS